ncbi:MAG: Bax inhibitor-1/YccA family protein [Chloroflexota bacterium]
MQSRDNDPYNRTQAPAGSPEQASRQGGIETLGGVIESSPPREGFLTGAFVWMFVGVLLSALSAWFVLNNRDLQETVTDYWLFLLLGQLGLVFVISFAITRISSAVALALFFVYALTMGLTLGVIVLAYVGTIGISGVVSAFAGAAAIFGGAALYGGLTKRDLTNLGGILFMGLLGLIVVMFLQLFFFADSSTASLLIGIGGVVIFTGLTAWDVQRLKNGAMPNINRDSATVLGALALYLDFVNLFLFLLRIFGSSR